MNRRGNKGGKSSNDKEHRNEQAASNEHCSNGSLDGTAFLAAEGLDPEDVPIFWQRWWFPIALTFICYSPNLLIYASDHEAWIYDDGFSARNNPCVNGVDSTGNPVPWTCIFWADYWGTPMSSNMSHKSYRPVTTAFFITERILWGFNDSRLWHLGNVATKAFATWLFGRVARLCLRCPQAALYATLLFAVHPIHTEAVSNITGQAETLSAVFMMLAFLAYARKEGGHQAGKFVASVLAGLAATLSKEPGFSALAVICVDIISRELRAVKSAVVAKQRDQDSPVAPDGRSSRSSHLLTWRDLRWVRPATWLHLAGYLVAGSAIFAGRCWIQGEKPLYSSFMNPGGFHHSRLTRGLTMAHYAVTHARLLTVPLTLCPDYSNSAIPEVESLTDQRCLPIFAAAICLGLAAVWLVRTALDIRRDVQEVATCASWLVIPFLPVSNLFFVVGFAVAERVLFAPSIGLCLLAGLGVSSLSKAISKSASETARLRLLSGLHKTLRCLLIILAVRTAHRDHDWNNSHSLWMSSYKSCSPNANVLSNLAISEPENPAFQRFLFERAIEVGKPFSQDHSVSSLAQLLDRMGQYSEMLQLCKRYGHFGNPRITLSCAVAKHRLQRHTEAVADYAELYQRLNDSSWHLIQIGAQDVIKGYVRALALSGNQLADELIDKHESTLMEPDKLHLLVSAALLAVRRNRTDDLARAVTRLAKSSVPGQTLTDLAQELRDLGHHKEALKALDAVPPQDRQAPPVAFVRQAINDGLYTSSERFNVKEDEMLRDLEGLSPVAALEKLLATADRVIQNDLTDSEFTLLHWCRLIIQPLDAILGRFGPEVLGSELMEVLDLYADGRRGDLVMHPRLLTDREKTSGLLAELGRLIQQVRTALSDDGALSDAGEWTMMASDKFFGLFDSRKKAQKVNLADVKSDERVGVASGQLF